MSIKEYINRKKDIQYRERKGLLPRPNGRSSDFVAPGLGTGCSCLCSYCYVARHRPYGNPLEKYTNRENIWKAVYNHWVNLPVKIPNQCDPNYWTYDIGESTDCLLPENIENTNWYVSQFVNLTNAKPTFATKIAGSKKLQAIRKERMARIRVSLMPQKISTMVEKGTSTINKRIEAIKSIYDLGFEVHINFSPVIVYHGWTKDYIDLFKQIDKSLSEEIKSQLKCEVIFLTHNENLSQNNLNWNPEAEQLLWKPQWQEAKTTQRGDCSVVRYKINLKNRLVDTFRKISSNYLSYCNIRYIF